MKNKPALSWKLLKSFNFFNMTWRLTVDTTNTLWTKLCPTLVAWALLRYRGMFRFSIILATVFLVGCGKPPGSSTPPISPGLTPIEGQFTFNTGNGEPIQGGGFHRLLTYCSSAEKEVYVFRKQGELKVALNLKSDDGDKFVAPIAVSESTQDGLRVYSSEYFELRVRGNLGNVLYRLNSHDYSASLDCHQMNLIVQ